MVGTMGTMNTDIDLQNDPDIPEARQMIIDLVGAHMGPTPKELPQFTNVAFHPILSGDDTNNLRLLIHAVYQAQSLIVSLPTGMTAGVMAGDEHGVLPDKDQILEDREGFELMPHPLRPCCDLGRTELNTGETVLAVAVFTVVASLTIAIPVIGYLIAGERIQPALDNTKDWMIQNNPAVTSVLLLVFCVILVGDAIGIIWS